MGEGSQNVGLSEWRMQNVGLSEWRMQNVGLSEWRQTIQLYCLTNNFHFFIIIYKILNFAKNFLNECIGNYFLTENYLFKI